MGHEAFVIWCMRNSLGGARVIPYVGHEAFLMWGMRHSLCGA